MSGRQLVGAAVLLGACGDPLGDWTYRGEPRWSLRGDVQTHTGAQPAELHRLRAALFWRPEGQAAQDLTGYVEQGSTGIPVQVFMPFQMNVFEAPPGAERAAYMIGRLAAYDDLDLDGRRGPAEPFVGLEVPTAIFYAPAELPAGRGPGVGVMPAGFHRLLLQQPCGKQAPGPLRPGTCGAPLGRACRMDVECAPGLCLQRAGIPWPDGACAVPEPPLDGCRPADARYYAGVEAGMMGMMGAPRGYFIKACARDEDCLRPEDKLGAAYRCDPGLQGCVPGDRFHLAIGLEVPVTPLCTR